jgi:hypothetical protein
MIVNHLNFRCFAAGELENDPELIVDEEQCNT